MPALGRVLDVRLTAIEAGALIAVVVTAALLLFARAAAA